MFAPPQEVRRARVALSKDTDVEGPCLSCGDRWCRECGGCGCLECGCDCRYAEE